MVMRREENLVAIDLMTSHMLQKLQQPDLRYCVSSHSCREVVHI